jgi:hypothetical protein
MGTITAANSVLTIGIASIYPTAQQIQGFQMDDAFMTDAIEPVQVIIGVDGFISAGYVPYLTKQTISIQADSPSITIFEDWLAAQQQQLEVYAAFGVLMLPSVSRTYILSQGYLTSIPPMPGARKVLQGRNMGVTWGSILPQPT